MGTNILGAILGLSLCVIIVGGAIYVVKKDFGS